MTPSAPMCPVGGEAPLLIDDLRAFGLVPAQVQAFRRLLGDGASGLLPLQGLAVRRGLLRAGGGHALVLSGVGSGKSTLAKLLFLHASHSGGRVVLLLSSARARRLARAQLATLIPEADAGAAICSPRVLLQKVRREPGFLAEVDLLLIDSLEGLLRPGQARRLAALLRAVQAAGPRLRLVGFAAQEAMAVAVTRVAEPLAAELICGPASAPLPLWLLERGTLRTYGDTQSEERMGEAEPLAEPPRVESLVASWGSDEQLLADSLLALCRRGQATLLRVPQRSRRLRLLHRLLAAGGAGLPPAERALAELSATAEGHGHELLRAALAQGMAFDGDELTPGQRRVVRRAQERGEVLLTLSQRLSRAGSANAAMHNIVCLAPLCGIGSRDADPGRPSGSALATLRRSLRRRLVANGRVLVHGRSADVAQAGAAQLAGAAEATSDWRRAKRHRPGVIGLRAGLRFLPVQKTGPRQGAAAMRLEPLEALTRVALFGGRLPLSLLLSERLECDYVALLLQRAGERGLAERAVFRWLLVQGTSLRHDDLRALKAVLLLDDWLAGLPGLVLERRYHVWLGGLVCCAQKFARRLRRMHWLDLRLAGKRRRGLVAGAEVTELVLRLWRIDVDGVAEHAPAPVGRHIGALLGALHAQGTALHLRPSPRLISRR